MQRFIETALSKLRTLSALCVLAAAVVFTGCATQPPVDGGAAVQEAPSVGEGGETESETDDMTATVEPEPEPEIIIPERPFPIETFYALLVAEVASERRHYDVWLGNYIQEAHRTRDPGVTAQAARIARYLNAHQAALNAALLWLQLEPDNSEALYMATSEYANSGQLLEAFNYSEQLLRKGSTPIFQSIAARAGQATDTQFESLSSEFDRLLVEFPDNAQLLLGKATLLHQAKELEEALALIQRVLDNDAEDVTAAIIEARLLTEMGRSEVALSRLLNLLQQNPNNQRLRLQYARLLASIDLQQARRQFEILVEQSPNDPDLLFSLALVANELNDHELAKSAFSRLLIFGSEQHKQSAHYYLGRIAEAEENFRLALEHFQQVQNGPDFLPALSSSVDILIRIGELEQAHQRIQELETQFPDQSVQLVLLEAQALAKYQHLEKAEQLLTQALTFNSNNADLLYTRAMINEQRDLIELMEDDLRTIIRYEPNNAAALNALGYVLANRTTRYDEALDLITRALDVKPDDPAIIDSMGWVQYRLGNYEEALIRLQAALKAFPDHEVAAHLGEVLWVMGDQKQARQVWSEALERQPGSDIIPEVMERLQVEVEGDE